MKRSHFWDVVVVGSAQMDFVIHADHLPKPGESIHGTGFTEYAGGKGVSQAIAAARLGANVALIAKVGSDMRGDEIIDRLQAEKVDTSFVFRDRRTATGACLQMSDLHGQGQSMSCSGANDHLIPDEVAMAADLFKSALVVVTQLEIPSSAVKRALIFAAESGAKSVLDGSSATGFDKSLIGFSDVLSLPASDAAAVTEQPVYDYASASHATQWFLSRGQSVVIVQTPHDGNLVAWNGHEHLVPAHAPLPLDKPSTDNAFIAGLATALSEGQTVVEATLFGNAAATLASRVHGPAPALPYRRQVFEVLAER